MTAFFSLSMVNDSKAQNSFEGGIIMARDFNGLKIKVAFHRLAAFPRLAFALFEARFGEKCRIDAITVSLYRQK